MLCHAVTMCFQAQCVKLGHLLSNESNLQEQLTFISKHGLVAKSASDAFCWEVQHGQDGDEEF